MQKSKVCVCGHQHEAHEHYRRGSDCALCGAEVCPKFRASKTAAVDDAPKPPAATTESTGGSLRTTS